jgi:hypothetical protein
MHYNSVTPLTEDKEICIYGLPVNKASLLEHGMLKYLCHACLESAALMIVSYRLHNPLQLTVKENCSTNYNAEICVLNGA